MLSAPGLLLPSPHRSFPSVAFSPRASPSQAPASLAAALGLRTPGLAAAAILPLVLTMLLFAGPLLALALSRPAGSSGSARSAAHSSSLWAQRIVHVSFAHALRNWVAAPLLEEFLFRGCLLSYLLAAGASPGRCIALSPALFAACHLHHLHELVRYQVGPGWLGKVWRAPMATVGWAQRQAACRSVARQASRP